MKTNDVIYCEYVSKFVFKRQHQIKKIKEVFTKFGKTGKQIKKQI